MEENKARRSSSVTVYRLSKQDQVLDPPCLLCTGNALAMEERDQHQCRAKALDMEPAAITTINCIKYWICLALYTLLCYKNILISFLYGKVILNVGTVLSRQVKKCDFNPSFIRFLDLASHFLLHSVVFTVNRVFVLSFLLSFPFQDTLGW